MSAMGGKLTLVWRADFPFVPRDLRPRRLKNPNVFDASPLHFVRRLRSDPKSWLIGANFSLGKAFYLVANPKNASGKR